jgi:predicted transcriptional regulator
MMSDSISEERPDTYIELTSEIVAAYVSNNPVQMREVTELVQTVHSALTRAAKGQETAKQQPAVPAVPINKSITPDYLISLEDGRRYKSLKRHLGGRGLTPQQYRTKYGLPIDYPLVAPNYAKQRSELAKAMGLGRARSAPAERQGSKRSRKG